MDNSLSHIRLLNRSDYETLKRLHRAAFGPGRFARTAYRIRESATADERLNLCIVQHDEMIGAIHFTPIRIGGVAGALLLGPLVIADTHKNQGYGLQLMQDGLKRAADLGYRLVILVGDRPYYARAGFKPIPAGTITMPGPVDTARLLYVELAAGALADFRGGVT